MKIFVMPVNNDGCSHYRINKPYKTINDNEIVFFEKKDMESLEALEYLEKCDYVLCRQYHDKSIAILDKLFKSKEANKDGKGKKLKVILDMDDFVFDIDPYSESYEIFGTKEVKHGDKYLWQDGVNIDIKANKDYIDSLKDFIIRADIVTVSTERLKKALSVYNDNIVVVHNAIDKEDWVIPNLKKHKEIRIGWTGGVSHYRDWWTVREDIEKIMNEYPQAKLVIAGAKFDGIFKNIDQDRIEFWKWVDSTGHGYRTALMDLDIAIIPLSDSYFNSNKSCIKFYEFSSLKVPTICSNVAPYSDEAPKESLSDNFYESIKYLIENPKERTKLGNKNYKWVEKNRSQAIISKKLEEILKKQLCQ